MAIDWDALYELAPADTTYVKDTDDAIRSLKTATRERVTKEHEFDLASQARQGLHRAGSAVAFYQASAPSQRNGVSLAAEDAGILYVDSDDKLLKVWDGDSFEGARAAVSNKSKINVTADTGYYPLLIGGTQGVDPVDDDVYKSNFSGGGGKFSPGLNIANINISGKADTAGAADTATNATTAAALTRGLYAYAAGETSPGGKTLIINTVSNTFSYADLSSSVVPAGYIYLRVTFT